MHSETYFTLANDTYQGLTTCQALMPQNFYSDRNLLVGFHIQVPLRCACPTPHQTASASASASAVKFLLTYLVTWDNDIPFIAHRFVVNQQTIWNANHLSLSDIIFPFTPLLILLHTQPSAIQQFQQPHLSHRLLNPTTFLIRNGFSWELGLPLLCSCFSLPSPPSSSVAADITRSLRHHHRHHHHCLSCCYCCQKKKKKKKIA